MSENSNRNSATFSFSGFEEIKSLKNVPNAKIEYAGLKTITVPEDIYTNPLDLSAIVESNPQIIKLETNADCLIGQIDNIFFDEDKVFVVDKRVSEAVFIFSRDGKFHRKLSKKGKGPGEYLQVYDVAIDRANNRMVVLDLMGRKLSFYDYDCNFLFSKRMFYFYTEIAMFDSVNLAEFTSISHNAHVPSIYNHDLVVGDISGAAYFKAFPLAPVPPEFIAMQSSRHLRDFNGLIDFYPKFSDTIFHVDRHALQAKYFIDFQGKGFPKRNNTQISSNEYSKLSSQYPHFMGEYVDLEKYLYLTINHPKGPAHLFYDKQSGHIRGGTDNQITRFSDYFFERPITAIDKNRIVLVKYPSTLIGWKTTWEKEIKDKWVGKTSKEIEEMIHSIKETDNPVIFLFSLKPF